MSDGNALVAKDREAHHHVAQLLYVLQEKSTTDSDFSQKFDELMAVLRPHLKDEEDTDMPELEFVLTRAESEDLAKEFKKTKKLSPTRSHPWATSFQPPFETAFALMTAPIDKVSVEIDFVLTCARLWIISVRFLMTIKVLLRYLDIQI